MTKRLHRQSGFTAVELLITLFVAAAFLIAAYQLFNLVVKDGGSTRAESRAANVAYSYLRQYAASSTTIPCTASKPLNNVSTTVDGLTNVTISITISCLPSAISSLSKTEASISYNSPVQTVKYATYSSSTGAATGTTDTTTGLIAWFKLNGDATDASGNGYNGTVSGATLTTGQNGAVNSAYSFNGTSSFISLPNAAAITGNNSYTLSAWIQPTDMTTYHGIIGWGTWGTLNAVTAFRTQNESGITGLRMYWWNNDLAGSAPSLGNGSWHHALTTFDGTTRSIYVDSVLVSSDTPSGHNAIATDVNIGRTNGGEYFVGSIDDVRIYNRALPNSDILALYSGGAK